MSTLSHVKTLWEPVDSVPTRNLASARKVQFDQSERESTKFLPNIPSISKAKRAISPPVDEADKLAKVAKKKRQRVLDRHKKLVERLRASGVGMKQIYTILGITSK